MSGRDARPTAALAEGVAVPAPAVARWGGAPIAIALEPADQEEVTQLIDELDAYQEPLYPPESHHGIGLAELLEPHVLFAVARDSGRAIGCCAVVLGADHAELKRMFVRPGCRGRGVGSRLLAFLEQAARARGCRRFALETGIHQREALALYLRAGYARCEPFGSYRPDPMSIFMCKDAG